MGFVDNLKRLITRQLRDAPIDLCRQMELVFCFLDVAQADCRQYGGEDIPGCVTEGYGFSKGVAGCGAVSVEEIGIAQRPVSVSAGRQVAGVQILQGAARLGKHDFYLIASESQNSPGGGNSSNKVSGLVVGLGA